MLKNKKVAQILAIITVTATFASSFVACGEETLEGEAVTLSHFNGITEDGSYDSSLFYRNDLTIFGGDSDVVWVSKEQDPENGGYFYQYTSGNGGVATNWYEEDHSYGVSCLRSRDLNDWELCGAVDNGFAARFEKADWIYDSIWAPEVIYDDVTEKYYMFFSAASWQDEGHLAGYENAYGEGRDYNPVGFHITTFVADVPQGPFRAMTSAEYYTFNGETEVKNDDGETVNKNGDVITSRVPAINFEDHFQIEAYIEEMYKDTDTDYKESEEYQSTMLSEGVLPAIDCSPFIDYDEDGNRHIYLFFAKHWIGGRMSIWGMEMTDWCTPNYESMRMIAYPNAESVKYIGNGAEVWDDASYERIGTTEAGEGTLIEGAQMLAHTGSDGVKRYYLTYSHTGYAARDYGCHQAISTQILGDDYEYKKLPRSKSALTVNNTNDYMTGVGHHAYVEADGELFNVYWVHADPTTTDEAHQNGRVYAFDRQFYSYDPDLGYDILYGNGPTKSLQPLPKAVTGLDNVALDAKISVTNAADEDSKKWLNDGCFTVLDSYTDREYRAKGKTIVTLTFDKPKEVSAILIYNSMDYQYAFKSVDNILFTLSEKPRWYDGTYTGQVVISDLAVSPDTYNASDPANKFMRQGGGAVASFKPVKVNKIEIEISQKLSNENEEIRISDIWVLGK